MQLSQWYIETCFIVDELLAVIWDWVRIRQQCGSERERDSKILAIALVFSSVSLAKQNRTGIVAVNTGFLYIRSRSECYSHTVFRANKRSARGSFQLLHTRTYTKGTHLKMYCAALVITSNCITPTSQFAVCFAHILMIIIIIMARCALLCT